MSHIVKKKIGNHKYLYLQESYYDKNTKKRHTRHIAYLGAAGNYSEEDIQKVIEFYDNPKNKGKKWNE